MSRGSTTGIPATPEEITAEWLTAALSQHQPGVVVSSVEVLDVREVTNTHVRLRIEVEAGGSDPVSSSLFVKMLPLESSRRDAVAATGMGQREARFYRELAPTLSMRLPHAHLALFDDETGAFIVALDDLDSSNCLISDGTWGVSPEAAMGALAALAQLHARFEDPARRELEVPWIPEATHGRSYGANMLRYGLDHHGDRLSTDFAAIAELYISDNRALHHLWHRGPLTVVHGDPHIGNLFIDIDIDIDSGSVVDVAAGSGARVGFLDWGIINITSPMRDVSYFMNMALSVDDRRAHERALLRHYLDVRRALGAAPISYDEAWLAHRLHAAYTVPACCQIVTFPANATAARQVFAAAFLARAEAALGDLEARKAVADQLSR